jgi:pimeloyl-ACP methyl ester carboxylesterase
MVRKGAMEPRIRYATSSDGVSIAFWTLGEGKPLVCMAGGPWCHVESWYVPECRRWYERLAQKRMLVWYDLRGTGWSEREVSDYSLETLVADVEAVVDRLGLDEFAMLGAADAGPVAVAYAARHPERISRLVLWCSWARTSDLRSPRMEAWFGLMDQDWELTTDTCVHTDKEVAPAETAISPRPGPKGGSPMARHRILCRGLRDETRHTILREAEHRLPERADGRRGAVVTPRPYPASAQGARQRLTDVPERARAYPLRGAPALWREERDD